MGGMAMRMADHEDPAIYHEFMSGGFAVAALAAGLLRALTAVDPVRWGVFTAYATSITALALAARSEAMLSFLMRKHLMPHTAFLGICMIATVMIIPVLGYIYVVTRGDVPSVHAAHHRRKYELSE